MTNRIAAALILFLASATAAIAAPPTWTVNQAKSALTFSVQVNGLQVTGKFDAFGALIKFDPANLGASSAKITMDMTAVKTKAAGRPKSEDRTRDATLLKPEWFNVLDFPQAVFETKKIVSTGKNTYEAQGTLKLKGISRPVKLPFTLVISGRTAQMAGEATVPRLDFKVGPAADDTEEISAAPEVKVMVKILATRAN